MTDTEKLDVAVPPSCCPHCGADFKHSPCCGRVEGYTETITQLRQQLSDAEGLLKEALTKIKLIDRHPWSDEYDLARRIESVIKPENP